MRGVARQEIRDELLRYPPLKCELRVLLYQCAAQDVDLLGVVALALRVPYTVREEGYERVCVPVRPATTGAAGSKA